MTTPRASKAATLTLASLFASVLIPIGAAASKGSVSVYYAASLVGLNEQRVGPAFQHKTGYAYQGTGLGSGAIANEIKSHIATPDVVEFADPAINAQLMGSTNGNYVSWYINFARTRLVIAFNPKSKYALLFNKVNHHKIAWFQPFMQRGLRLGRTDPQIDPKGYRAIWTFNLAQKLFHLKNFERSVLGSVDNANQVFPEQVLLSRLQTGELDAGVFYLSEVQSTHIPYISLPQKIDLGEPKYAKIYATQHFTNNQHKTFTGAPILYTITIPTTVKNLPAAKAFVKFILSKPAQRISEKYGLLPTRHLVGGDRRKVPPGL
jgi:molybdate/tungstate transport system substrate-binding protein